MFSTRVDKTRRYQMQFPFPYLGGMTLPCRLFHASALALNRFRPDFKLLAGQQALLEGFAEAVDLGLCKAVGVCNFDVNEIQEAHAVRSSPPPPPPSPMVIVTLPASDQTSMSCLFVRLLLLCLLFFYL